MGILKPGIQCIVMKGINFGKKITINKVDNKFVYYTEKDKEKKIGLTQVFPIK
jgi:hypothetical protein